MGKINRFVMENGLRVLHIEDNSTQMVVVNTLFMVGAKDEDPLHTGLAHLTEHLMFTGSENVEDFDALLEMAGGENNAFTTQDITNYYIQIPRNNLEIALYVESDRMKCLTLSDDSIEAQRSVVLEEFKQREINKPYGDMMSLLNGNLFTGYPYEWNTIGKHLSHIEQVDKETIKQFVRNFYCPNNAVLCIVGNVGIEEVGRLVSKYYSDIPANPGIRKKVIGKYDMAKSESKRIVERRNVPNHKVALAFHSPNRTHPDYCTSDIISDILANGQSSRMINRLVREEKKFYNIDAYITGNIEAGAMIVTGTPAKGVGMEEAEELIWRELRQISSERIEARELEKVINKFEANKVAEESVALMKAQNIAYHEAIGMPDWMETSLDKYRAITAEDAMRVSKDIFNADRAVTLWYEPSL